MPVSSSPRPFQAHLIELYFEVRRVEEIRVEDVEIGNELPRIWIPRHSEDCSVGELSAGHAGRGECVGGGMVSLVERGESSKRSWDERR